MSQHIAIIKQVLSEKLRVSEDFLDDDFTLDELGLDSLTSAEVVLGVEKRLGVRIDVSALGETLTRETRLGELIGVMAGMLEEAPCPA